MTEDLTQHTRAALLAIAPEFGEPPADIAKAVQRVVDVLLKGSVRYESAYPSRPDVRRRMQKLREAADLILRDFHGITDDLPMVSDPKVFPLRKFMIDPREHSDELDGELGRNLTALRNLCDVKLQEMPIRGGRDHAVPIGEAELTASGGTLCAITVSLLWEAIHGVPPTIDNKKAWSACAELWHAAGGKHLRTYSSGWRKDMIDSRKKRYDEVKNSLRAVLSDVNRFRG